MQNFQNHIGIVWDILVIDLLIHMCRRAVAVIEIVSNDKMENSPYYRVPSCSTRIIRPLWSLIIPMSYLRRLHAALELDTATASFEASSGGLLQRLGAGRFHFH